MFGCKVKLQRAVILWCIGLFFCVLSASAQTTAPTAPSVSFTVPIISSTDVALNQKIAVMFSEPMTPSTVTRATFTLRKANDDDRALRKANDDDGEEAEDENRDGGGDRVAGVVSYAGVTATFTPRDNLAPNTKYTARVSHRIRSLTGNQLAENFGWSFTTGATLSTAPPAVSFTVPPLVPPVVPGTLSPVAAVSPVAAATVVGNGGTGVPISGAVAATFSEAMDPLTITGSTFTLTQGATPVAGVVSYAGVTATFTPTSFLAPLTVYTATVTTGARSLTGTPLAADFSWTFTTGVTPDTTRPLVNATVPANGTLGVPVNQKVAAVFSKAMDPLTVTTATFALRQGTTRIPGIVSYVGLTATFIPISSLAPNTAYTAQVTTGARDLAGNAPAADFTWSFTTSATLDTTPPFVTVPVPTSGATGVAVNQTINATFSKAMDPLTVTAANLKVTGPSGAITGIVAYDVISRIASFIPTNNLAANSVYTTTVTGAKDLAGNAAAIFGWSFTTAAVPIPAGPAPVALGAASTFEILAASTATNTGLTTVNGDLGLSPGTAVTGFPPGIVNGTIYAGVPAAALAQLDLTTAYNDAAGRTVGAILLADAENLGGLTLAPGLYKSNSSLAISSGDLTLDAKGDVNAVWIFQMGSTLTTTAGRKIILANGAKAANIFWQVGSSATLGTGSVFEGNILALASITVTTGATVDGHLFARTGAVTLDTDVVSIPAP